MPVRPAAMPDTCVPCGNAGSPPIRPSRPELGPGNARMTITFGVVHFFPPLGNPGGKFIPSGFRNGFVWSMPVSTTAILTPSPMAPVRWWSASAWMICGLSFVFTV